MAIVVGGRVMSSGLTEENGGSNRAVGDSRGSNGGEIKEAMKNELRRGKGIRGEREIRVCIPSTKWNLLKKISWILLEQLYIHKYCSKLFKLAWCQ
jgi:hypothetical protein